ncbi:CAP domain-containing protein [Streptomyces sp. NPDC059255]|uniref:CAP domain-containing protein n=1 Tax=Streptomyces sp. NPDC059255 TaxID=3346793 RepID=UPI00368B39D5
MGRHRRSAAPGAPVESPEGPAAGPGATPRRKGRVTKPVRTGLLGASAAMAVGAVAVASGLLPGGGQFSVSGGGTTGEQIRSEGAPELQQQGGTSADPTRDARVEPSRSAERTTGPEKKPASPSSAAPSSPTRATTAPAPPKPKTEAPSKETESGGSAGSAGSPAQEDKAPAPAPTQSTDRAAEQPQTAPSSAASAVLSLVNKERAKAGCAALKSDASLNALAQSFSEDMAARGFFDHTDPDGDSPWDRAEQAGVKNLGGENIARGQATAEAVMDSWMNSEGHRANILNCDYTRLGVGVHTGSGGPWWTQNFGF